MWYICKCGHIEEVSENIEIEFKQCRKCKRVGIWGLLEEDCCIGNPEDLL